MPQRDANMRLVRTTVRIDDDLYRRVKQRAATEGRTVAAVLEDAVRLGMTHAGATGAAAPFVTPRQGRGGLAPGVDVASNAAWRDLLDEGSPLEQMR